MKNTTIILLLLLLVLGGAAAWYMGGEDKKTGSTYKTENMDFAVDPAKIHKIFIANREGGTSTLIRDGEEWLYEGEFKTRPNAMAYLLEAIGNLEVSYRPAKAAYPAIVKDLATFGLEVELYDENGELLKNYYVGGQDEKGEGSYMIMAESEEPFAMHIKNFVGGLRLRYSLEGDDWRDRAVFSEDPKDITSVTVEYPKQKNKSFKLTQSANGIEVEPLFSTTSIIDKKVLAGKGERYLNGFKSKIAENFQNEYTMKDFAKTVTPFSIVNVTFADGTEKNVRFIPYQKVDKNGNLLKPDPSIPDFRYHADCSWGDFMVVQQRVFEEIFWAYESFYR